MKFTALFSKSKLFLAVLISSFLFYTNAWAETVNIPASTRVYVELDQEVIGKKKYTTEGQTVRASVWRDVVVDGRVVISAGTPVVVRVDTLKGSKIAGGKGKMTLGAYETKMVDGTPVQLGGGYYKEGKGKVALAVSLAVVVALPLIFIKGKSAQLPRGTVFDAFVDQSVTVELPDEAAPVRTVNLTNAMDEGFDAEVLYNELEGVEKPKVFPFSIQAPVGNSGKFVIDTINGEQVEAIELDANQTGAEGNVQYWRGEVSIKELVKQLKKGLNTFEVSTMVNGERVSKEILLDIQI